MKGVSREHTQESTGKVDAEGGSEGRERLREEGSRIITLFF